MTTDYKKLKKKELVKKCEELEDASNANHAEYHHLKEELLDSNLGRSRGYICLPITKSVRVESFEHLLKIVSRHHDVRFKINGWNRRRKDTVVGETLLHGHKYVKFVKDCWLDDTYKITRDNFTEFRIKATYESSKRVKLY